MIEHEMLPWTLLFLGLAAVAAAQPSPGGGSAESAASNIAALQPATPAVTPDQTDYRTLWGYGFYGRGLYVAPVAERMTHLGAGFEWLVRGPLGVGTEVGVITVGEGAGAVISINGIYILRRRPANERSFVPFVTAGYTRGPGRDQLTSGLVNAGAGVNYWSRGGEGVRLEVRYHDYANGAYTCSSRINCRNWFLDFRIGATFGR